MWQRLPPPREKNPPAIHNTVRLVIAGMLLISLTRYGPEFLHSFSQYSIVPEVIFIVFLPIQICGWASNLDYRQFRQNILPALQQACTGIQKVFEEAAEKRVEELN